jgi:hypothetical protein
MVLTFLNRSEYIPQANCFFKMHSCAMAKRSKVKDVTR